MFKPTFTDKAKQQWKTMPEGPIKDALRHQIAKIIKGEDRGTLIQSESNKHYRASTVLVGAKEYMILWKEEGYNPTIMIFIDLGSPRTFPGPFYSTTTK